MSHMVKVKTSMKNKQIQAAACRRLKLDPPVQGSYRFMDGKTAEGSVIRLKGWNHPLVIEESGEARFDNYGGSWGDIKRLNELKQAYAVETVLSVSRGRFMVNEIPQDNGFVRLQLQAIA